MRAMLLLTLLVALGACASTAPPPAEPPADFSLRYEWVEGSMPPPYHYEYTIEIGGGAGRIIFRPSYPSDTVPTWTEPFTLDQGTIERVYRQMIQAGVWDRQWRQLDPAPVGGATERLVVTAQGRQINVSSSLVDEDARAVEPVYEAIRALVPQATWDKLRAQQKDYNEANRL